jgi:hypothetical protein
LDVEVVGDPSRVGDPELSFFVLIGKQTIELEQVAKRSISLFILPKKHMTMSASYELTLTCHISQYYLGLRLIHWAMYF